MNWSTGRTVLGKHHLTVLCLGRSIDEMERCVQDVTTAVQNLGVTVVREDMNAEPAFWAQMPGNFSYIARAALISSRNFVGFASLHNFAVGKRDEQPLGSGDLAAADDELDAVLFQFPSSSGRQFHGRRANRLRQDRRRCRF